MEIRYERDLVNAYMILPAVGESGYQRRMILENRIRGFLPVQKRCHDNEEEYYYCISSRTSMTEYLDHTPLTESFLKQLIFTVCQSAAVLEEYLLTGEILLLQPETIYIQENTKAGDPFCGTFILCLYPDEKQDMKEKLRQLMKYLMGKTGGSEDTCATLCYELYGLLQKDNFCLREFMAVLEHSPTSVQTKEPEKKKWTKQLFANRRNSGIM